LGDEVASKLADRGAALVANHGLVTCGSSPEKALHNAALAERTAKIVWGTRAMGGTVNPLPEKVNRNMAGVYKFIRENP
jgi:L-fuculose-phosphate aldolase